MPRSAIVIAAIVVAVVIASAGIYVANTQAAPGDPVAARGVDRASFETTFTENQALAHLEEEVRDICADAHPNALAHELDRARKVAFDEEDDHWKGSLPPSGFLQVRVFPDGAISGNLIDFIARKCGAGGP